MQAHGRLPQEPWTYDPETLAIYRGYVLLHEMLNPYLRAGAETAARAGLPIVRPASLLDPGGWEVADAYGLGTSLWVAPVVDEHAREREAWLPPGEWVETWSGARVRGGREVLAPAPLHAIPVWVRAGAIVVTHPAEDVRDGLGEGDAEAVLATRGADALQRQRALAVERREAEPHDEHGSEDLGDGGAVDDS